MRPPDVAPSFSTFQAPVRPEAAPAKGESKYQLEPAGLARELTAVRAAAVSEEARKKQAAAARAAREQRAATAAAAKAAVERARPLQLARASLATYERCRKHSDEPNRLRHPQRAPPSEAGRALLVALGVDENNAANAQRLQSNLGGGVPRTRPSSGRMASDRPPSRTRSQSSHSSSRCGSASTPWLGIGFDESNADPWGRDEALAREEPPACEQELEVVCEPDGDTQLQGLQAELERVRRLEAMLHSEKERGVLMSKHKAEAREEGLEGQVERQAHLS